MSPTSSLKRSKLAPLLKAAATTSPACAFPLLPVLVASLRGHRAPRLGAIMSELVPTVSPPRFAHLARRTIAGGSGAGPSWDGTSGVHTHMSAASTAACMISGIIDRHTANTRMTDPESFERSYPVVLRQFSLREGAPTFFLCGGTLLLNSHRDRRDRRASRRSRLYTRHRIPRTSTSAFSPPLLARYQRTSAQASILSERRAFRPYGLEGGSPGAAGRNTWIKQRRGADSDLLPDTSDQPPRCINLGGKQTVKMGAGDRIIIETPGGGGWGVPSNEKKERIAAAVSHDRGAARGSYAERRAAQEGV